MNATTQPIDPRDLAKAMCIADGQNPADKHNGHDPVWRLYWSAAVNAARVYNELFADQEPKDPT